ncbi:MAG TPA: thiol:disulfide interchange protein DsbA/DsbL [Burkholderiaceae bacterium]|nr:thiol:disulfide interchange protein DsbA/DsbL [Burkholderiaceae bacterium]
MNRRSFSLTALLGAAAFGTTRPLRAQGGPVEGAQYVRLMQPLPVSVEPGKIEVIDFFRYGCPHCYAFEPTLDAWARQLPDDVVLRRVPAAFGIESFAAHQRIYYALDTLGLLPTLHRKVFNAIHQERLRLDQPAEISAFVERNGADAAKFMEAYGSFGVQARVRQANQLVGGYKIDGVPALGIHGRFYTSGTLTGDNTRALAVTDYLVQRLRKPA